MILPSRAAIPSVRILPKLLSLYEVSAGLSQSGKAFAVTPPTAVVAMGSAKLVGMAVRLTLRNIKDAPPKAYTTTDLWWSHLVVGRDGPVTILVLMARP